MAERGNKEEVEMIRKRPIFNTFDYDFIIR